jgi:hypothetical protein
LVDQRAYSCAITVDEPESDLAPEAFVRYHNMLNVTLNTFIEIAFDSETFWPPGGGTVNITAGDIIIVKADWADGTKYRVSGTEEGFPFNSTSHEFTYHGLDLYAFYDTSVPAGFVILDQKRVVAEERIITQIAQLAAQLAAEATAKLTAEDIVRSIAQALNQELSQSIAEEINSDIQQDLAQDLTNTVEVEEHTVESTTGDTAEGTTGDVVEE